MRLTFRHRTKVTNRLVQAVVVALVASAVTVVAIVTAGPAAAPTNVSTVTGVIAASGPAAGGQRVTVLGLNLIGPTAVHFGATTAAILSSTAGSVTVTSPAGSAGLVDVTVTTSNGTSAVSGADHYTYTAAAAGVAYVANSGGTTVTPITVATNTPGTPITVGTNPYGVAFSPDGSKAYVTNQTSGTVTPITVATNTPGTPITVGTNPAGVAFSPDGTKAYIANYSSNTITPITVATNTPGTAITVGTNPREVAFSPDGSKAYVTNTGSNTITPITVATNTPGTAITVGTSPHGVAFSPDGSKAYVTNTGITRSPRSPSPPTPPAAPSPSAPAHSRSRSPRTAAPPTSPTTATGRSPRSPSPPAPPAPPSPSAPAHSRSRSARTAEGLRHQHCSGTVTPITVATNTPGTAITVGTSPYGVAFSPAAPLTAPTAWLTATVGAAGSATSFDGSASGATAGTISNYAWTFGDSATSPTNATATTTHVYAAAGTYTATLTVTDSNGKVSVAASRAIVVPTAVTAITPTAGPLAGGTVVTITGGGFSTTGTTVQFGNFAATAVTCASATTCTATSPAGVAGTVDVTVTNGGTSPPISVDQFTYVAAPTITSISATKGVLTGGTAVVIVTSRVHSRSRCSVTGLPCTPMLAIRPTGRTSSAASSKVAGTPTASIATSTPEATGELADGRDRVLLGVVDDHVGAELLGRLEPAGRHVDRDDQAGAEQPGAGDRRQADRAGADDGDDVARPDLAVEDADLVGGGQDVGQHEQFLVADPGRHRIGRVVGERDADVLGLGAVDLVAEDPATAAGALPVAGLAAEPARAAGADAGHQHPIADRQVLHGRADLGDRADGLVADDAAVDHRRQVALEDVQVGAADRGRVDPHDRVGVGGEYGVGTSSQALTPGPWYTSAFMMLLPI